MENFVFRRQINVAQYAENKNILRNFVKIYTQCEKYEQYIKEKYGTGYLKQFKSK